MIIIYTCTLYTCRPLRAENKALLNYNRQSRVKRLNKAFFKKEELPPQFEPRVCYYSYCHECIKQASYLYMFIYTWEKEREKEKGRERDEVQYFSPVIGVATFIPTWITKKSLLLFYLNCWLNIFRSPSCLPKYNHALGMS